LGRDTDIAHMRAIADVGATTLASTVIATRGERLMLSRIRFSGRDELQDFHTELLGIVEIDPDERIVARVSLDLDDIDAAFVELDGRYLTGDPADHCHTWSVIAGAYAAFNRREMFPTTPDWVNIDHRRGTPLAAAGDITAAIRAFWDLTPDFSMHIEAVHRLSNFGAVITHTSFGTSQSGFDAEWRMIQLLTVEGDQVNRCELFDEADLDTALARFDELNRQPRLFENAAIRTWARLADAFNRRDVDEFLALISANGRQVDRRKGLRAIFEGPARQKAVHALFEAPPSSWQMEVEPIAIRGSRLALTRERYRDTGDANRPIVVELLSVMEVSEGDLVHDSVDFDPDDIDAAFEELDARYLAGEAAACSQTWSVILRNTEAFNRRELPAATPNFVNFDHRRAATSFAPGELTAYLGATWDLTPQVTLHIEAVHRLSSFGAVVIHAAHATSQDGFTAEWRVINLLTFEGDLMNRCELFDDADIDAAIAKFDELSRHAPRLENAAMRAYERLQACFLARDWIAIAQGLSVDHYSDDRRRVVNSGIRHGRDAEVASLQATADLGVTSLTSIPIAIRGDRLALTRTRGATSGPEAFDTELLRIVEIDADDRIVTRVVFGLDDIDAAFNELDARYLAGEAVAYVHAWSLVTQTYAAFNRRKLSPTTPGWEYLDHRLIASAPDDMTGYIRAAWDLTPDVKTSIESVHRLNDLGAVVTVPAYGTSQHEFHAEWRELHLLTFEGDLINRLELFDEADLDSALARFDELSRQPPPFGNAATRAWARQTEAFNRRNLDGFLAGYNTAEVRYEDRRQGLRDDTAGPGLTKRARALFEAPKGWRTEMEPVAIRGPRLALTRDRYRDTDSDRTITAEHLTLTEVGDDDLVYRTELFDPDDINGAIGELTARWIASGDVAHPHVIEAVCRLIETVNSHEWDAFATLSAGATYVNHRQLSSPGVETIADHMPSIRTMASLVPDYWVELAEVLTHSPIAVVGDVVLRGTSTDGLAIEIPLVMLVVVDRDRVTRLEAFDPDQRDLALARFEELNEPT
jgi:hypothetical protein